MHSRNTHEFKQALKYANVHEVYDPDPVTSGSVHEIYDPDPVTSGSDDGEIDMWVETPTQEDPTKKIVMYQHLDAAPNPHSRAGATNLALFCSIITVLQVLAHTPVFSSGMTDLWLLINEMRLRCNDAPTSACELCLQMAELMKELREALAGHVSAISHATIETLKRRVSKDNDRFKKNIQHDWYEFFCQLMLSIDAEYVKISSAFDSIGSPNSIKSPPPIKSPIETFGLRICETRKCNSCELYRNEDQELLGLCLSFPEDAKRGTEVTVTELIRQYLASEIVEFPCIREGCTEASATRHSQILVAPEALVVSLKRTLYSKNGICYKLTGIGIKIQPRKPLVLDEHTYKLYAVVCHEGEDNDSGHYYTCVFNENDGKWYHCSDASVRKVKPWEINQYEVCALCYKLVSGSE